MGKVKVGCMFPCKNKITQLLQYFPICFVDSNMVKFEKILQEAGIPLDQCDTIISMISAECGLDITDISRDELIMYVETAFEKLKEYECIQKEKEREAKMAKADKIAKHLYERKKAEEAKQKEQEEEQAWREKEREAQIKLKLAEEKRRELEREKLCIEDLTKETRSQLEKEQQELWMENMRKKYLPSIEVDLHKQMNLPVPPSFDQVKNLSGQSNSSRLVPFILPLSVSGQK